MNLDPRSEREVITIYVAGASAELERAREALQWIDAHGPRIKRVGMDWVAAVDKERTGAGKADHHLTDKERQHYAKGDLRGVLEAHILWLLLPPLEVHTVGLWVEFGFGLCKLNVHDALGISAPRPMIIASGPDKYLFTSLVTHHFNTDYDAQVWLYGLL